MEKERPRLLSRWVADLWNVVLFPGRTEIQSAIRPWALVLLIILPGVLLYPTLQFHLLEPDEGRYAQIPREMLARGEYIVPTLQSQPYLDKPPLLYWLVMASYSLFGVSEASARLIPAMAVHLTILMVYLLGRRSMGERSAFWGALLLTITPGYMGMGRLLIMDGLLTMWVTLALFAGFETVRTGVFQRRWWYITAIACGFGVLTKGPIPLILMIPPIWLHGRLTQQRVHIPWKHVAGFFSVVFMINLPWYVGIYLKEPIFLRYFFWEHNIMRFIKPFDHLEPVWFYLPIVLAGLLPGTLLLVAFAKHLLSADEALANTRTKELGFWLLAGGWCVLFFSLSGCKLPTYILPAFPCFLLALGDFIAKTQWRTAFLTRSTVACSTLLLVVGFYVLLPRYAELRSPMGPVEIAERLKAAQDETIICFPRNVDSVAFYTGRDDLRSMRSKQSQELVERILKEERAMVLFTHRHSLESFKAVLPKGLEVAEAKPVKHRGTGAAFLDKIVGDGPWGLCDIAVIQKVPQK